MASANGLDDIGDLAAPVATVAAGNRRPEQKVLHWGSHQLLYDIDFTQVCLLVLHSLFLWWGIPRSWNLRCLPITDTSPLCTNGKPVAGSHHVTTILACTYSCLSEMTRNSKCNALMHCQRGFASILLLQSFQNAGLVGSAGL